MGNPGQTSGNNLKIHEICMNFVLSKIQAQIVNYTSRLKLNLLSCGHPKKGNNHIPLSIQVCPEKGIKPTILLWGWDWDYQTYSREGYGSLGFHYFLLGVILLLASEGS